MAKITREQAGVKAGDKIIVKGKVAFARLDKAVTGDALVRENERRSKLGMLPTKEFRSITIEDVEMVKGENTPLANYYAQRVYSSATSGKQTMSIESKSLYPPQYGHIVNGVIQEIPDPQKNPAQGQIVYLMISAFAPKGFSNLGSSFDAIVFEEGPIKFYEGSNSLTGFGEAMDMQVTPLQAQPEAQQQIPPVVFEQPQPQQMQQAAGFSGAPIPQNQPQPNTFGLTDANVGGNGSPFDNQTFGNTPFNGSSPFGNGANNAPANGNSPFA